MFTLAVLGTVQLAVLQGLAVAGVTLGSICYFLGLDFLPPTMAAYAKMQFQGSEEADLVRAAAAAARCSIAAAELSRSTFLQSCRLVMTQVHTR